MKEEHLRMNAQELPGLELKINSETSILTIPVARDDIRVFKFDTKKYQYFVSDKYVCEDKEGKIKNIRPIIKNELNQAGVWEKGIVDYVFENMIDPFVLGCYKNINEMDQAA